jgi:Fur family ferric uptake transcriptional regulator
MLNLQSALKILREYLKDNKLRFTGERLIVLEEIFTFSNHFDAEQLFIHIRKKYNHISRATVYRTLELFHKIGIIKKENLGQDYSSYELSMDRPHHDHMICVECGKVIEFVDEVIERRQKEICNEKEVNMIRHHLQIFVRCKSHDQEK